MLERLKNENKDLKTLVKICDEKEYEDKKEIFGLKTQLEEARRIEEVMSSKFKERDLQCKILEVEVDSARRELDENNKFYKKLGEELESMKD